MGLSRQEYWSGCPFLLQGLFLTQGSNLGLLHWRVNSLPETLSWSFKTLVTWWEEPTCWKRLWCWERLEAGGEGGERGWDDWMASPTQWTWIWGNSGRLWGTGRPGALQFTGLQRAGHDLATEQQQGGAWCPISPLRNFPFICLFFLPMLHSSLVWCHHLHSTLWTCLCLGGNHSNLGHYLQAACIRHLLATSPRLPSSRWPQVNCLSPSTHCISFSSHAFPSFREEGHRFSKSQKTLPGNLPQASVSRHTKSSCFDASLRWVH